MQNEAFGASEPMSEWGHILYGADYNPDQWPESVWDEDMRLMVEANANVATLPVFGWAALEPAEGRFTFEWLDRLLDKMHGHGIGACLATATASQPAWLDAAYPDVLVTGRDGVKRRHGNRHSFCPNSANYKRLATRLVRTMAERYRSHPALRLWHVNNEYGNLCFCEQCAVAFRAWLAAKYGTIGELNRRWYTAFWGHTFNSFDQIEPPTSLGEGSIQALQIDYHRFQSESLFGCFEAEASVLREVTPGVPVTTNFMGAFFNLDYHRWARSLDVVSWDNYPSHDAVPSDIAFAHALMRGLKEGQPFLLMEQSPSQQNWQPYNRLKPPGQLRLQSYQAVAQGAESVMYFQWRRGRGGIEKLHGAIVEHGGSHRNRVFQEVKHLGGELRALGGQTLGGRIDARVAMLFSWENWWALHYSSGPSRDLDYVQFCRHWYGGLFDLGVQVEVVGPDCDLSKFDVVIAPLLTMVPEALGSRIEEHVRRGATLIATCFSGLVDGEDMVYLQGAPGPLQDVLGVFVEETDALPPGFANGVRMLGDGATFETGLLCDRVQLRGAGVLGVYTQDFYAGEPAVTEQPFGQGRGIYVASQPSREGVKEILRLALARHFIGNPLSADIPPGVEVTERVAEDGARLVYLLNHAAQTVGVDVGTRAFEDLLSGQRIERRCELGPRGVAILRPE